EATPPLPGKQFRVTNTAPRLAWLDLDGAAVPILWTHQLPVYETGVNDSNRAAEGFNLLAAPVDRSAGVRSGIDAAAFIRLIEQRDALWFGHVEISGTHFDVEVDMTRLFAGSEALAEFAGRLAHHIVTMEVDLIVYPDESRIQFATATAIDDALAQRDA